MVTLDVAGPYEVPCWVNDGGTKSIEAVNGRDFFAENEWLADRRGCYIFAIRNRGLRAAYVGKATKSFRQEAFSVDKLNKVQSSSVCLGAW